jgi:hypothetical protein
MLSSTGKYAGVLDKIAVDGATDTPDFHIETSGRKVPLHTDFHAIVDGTSGDTYLQPVKAQILNTWLTASGSVVRSQNPKGHDVQLDVTIEKGRIEDLLRLAVRTEPPVMTGTVRLRTKFDLPPGEPDVANRLKLAGNFEVSAAHFTNEKIQDKIDALSMRSQGKPKLANDSTPENVHSDMTGTFDLGAGLLSFSQLEYRIPGTQVNLTGTYSLDGNQFDFHGKARMDAKLSQMVTGWKSILLKPVDPFFSKNGAGTEIPEIGRFPVLDVESVDGVGGLRALDFSFCDRKSIRRSAIGFPRSEVEMTTGRDLVDADVSEEERFTGLANSRRTGRANKVSSHSASDDHCAAIAFDQHSRFFVDGNFARRIGPAIPHDAGEKNQSSTHAVALGKVRIGEQVLEMGNL